MGAREEIDKSLPLRLLCGTGSIIENLNHTLKSSPGSSRPRPTISFANNAIVHEMGPHGSKCLRVRKGERRMAQETGIAYTK